MYIVLPHFEAAAGRELHPRCGLILGMRAQSHEHEQRQRQNRIPQCTDQVVTPSISGRGAG